MDLSNPSNVKSNHSSTLEEEQDLIQRAGAAVEAYMSQPQFDASHDIAHVKRVLALARHIMVVECRTNVDRTYNPLLVIFGALFHDVEDRKYATAAGKPVQTDSTKGLTEKMLTNLGCPPPIAARVQQIVNSVSYTKERSNPQLIKDTLQSHPELAIVQDADRLDALGAVGIARAFTYGGAKDQQRGLTGTILHFDEKLLHLESMMKTQEGRKLAAIRTDRLRTFKQWWIDETKENDAIEESLGLPR
ncbi:MAG: hypothetical protein L6R41_006468 [Letrouitia leprolyta]|nr:MAG: hypothetical protein L6R41_006468 [Letrouitia leprolyta]